MTDQPYTRADLETWIMDGLASSTYWAFRQSVVQILWRRFGGTMIPSSFSVARELGLQSSTMNHRASRGLALLREPARRAKFDLDARLVGTLLGRAVDQHLRRDELAWASVPVSLIRAHPTLSLSARTYLPGPHAVQATRDPEVDTWCDGTRLDGTVCPFQGTIWSPATGYRCGHHYRRWARAHGTPDAAVAVRDKAMADAVLSAQEEMVPCHQTR